MRYIIDRKTNEHERYDGQNYDATKYRIVEADSEGWIAHTGNECPLPRQSRVIIRCADGGVSAREKAATYDWSDCELCPDNRITHYRPILEKAQEPEPQTIGDLIRRDHPYKDRKQAEKVQEPEPAAELTTNTIDLLGTLARAHEHAAQIPDLEAELREVLAGMGYDLVSRSPFVEPEDYAAAIAEREPAVETPQDMSDWRNWKYGDNLVCVNAAGGGLLSKGMVVTLAQEGSVVPYFYYPGGEKGCESVNCFRFHSRPAKGE